MNGVLWEVLGGMLVEFKMFICKITMGIEKFYCIWIIICLFVLKINCIVGFVEFYIEVVLLSSI